MIPSSIPLTEIDSRSYCGPAQMLKAAIPYMAPEVGRAAALCARILELKKTMSVFDDENVSICSLKPGQRPDMEELLTDIKKYCSEPEAEQIDNFLNMLAAVKLYNQYTELTKNSDLSHLMNQMKNVSITPEQLQMVQALMQAPNGKSSQ